jgi:hypothetical protein
LRDVIVSARKNLSIRESQALEELIADYQDFFGKKGDLRRTEKVYQNIYIGGVRPILQQPRKLPLAKRAVVNVMLEDMKIKGVIEESDSHCSLLGVLVRKKRCFLRFCVDYRRLNDFTKKDCIPLPRIEHLEQADWNTVVLHTRPEKRILACGTASGR